MTSLLIFPAALAADERTMRTIPGVKTHVLGVGKPTDHGEISRIRLYGNLLEYTPEEEVGLYQIADSLNIRLDRGHDYIYPMTKDDSYNDRVMLEVIASVLGDTPGMTAAHLQSSVLDWLITHDVSDFQRQLHGDQGRTFHANSGLWYPGPRRD